MTFKIFLFAFNRINQIIKNSEIETNIMSKINLKSLKFDHSATKPKLNRFERTGDFSEEFHYAKTALKVDSFISVIDG